MVDGLVITENIALFEELNINFSNEHNHFEYTSSADSAKELVGSVPIALGNPCSTAIPKAASTAAFTNQMQVSSSMNLLDIAITKKAESVLS